MEAGARKAAKAAGLARYFTGKPCKRGHIDERYVGSYQCVICYGPGSSYMADWWKTSKGTAEGFLRWKYKDMKQRVSSPSRHGAKLYYGLSLMSLEEFMAWASADSVFNKLWKAFILSGRVRRLTPTIDRIDTLRGYVAGNVQFLTHSQNTKKALLWRHHGINPVIPKEGTNVPKVKRAA